MVNTKLIVGLGNPGAKYQNTRHNVGFMVIDYLVKLWNLSNVKYQFGGQFWSFLINNQTKIILAKPLTFMNLSGSFVQQITHFFQISPDQMLIIYDDVDLDCSKMRYRVSGGSGGHNGMGDIINKLKTTNIARLKIGIGPKKFDTANFVLASLTDNELMIINHLLPEITNVVEKFIGKENNNNTTNKLSNLIK